MADVAQPRGLRCHALLQGRLAHLSLVDWDEQTQKFVVSAGSRVPVPLSKVQHRGAKQLRRGVVGSKQHGHVRTRWMRSRIFWNLLGLLSSPLRSKGYLQKSITYSITPADHTAGCHVSAACACSSASCFCHWCRS